MEHSTLLLGDSLYTTFLNRKRLLSTAGIGLFIQTLFLHYVALFLVRVSKTQTQDSLNLQHARVRA